ncbi:3-dehydroquinate synthase [Aeromicrobium sp.]|uniref:3-dehydroquinate synthase n=1 Tax=Aeromicrobium sp. TaxID=1871063 RepID=UPI003C66A2C7
MTTRLTVHTASPYEVVVGHGVTDEARHLVGDDARRVAIIHSPALRDRADLLRAALVDIEVLLVEVPDGEAAKSAEVLTRCWDELGDAGFTRSDVVIGLGGGSTTDLAGFVAASWLRGVRFVNLPTTVLGMVDAAVGGKTGINTASGKNLVGAFHEPAGVLCDLDTLTSLSVEEMRSGLAEVVKCGFIADPTILELVEAAPESVLDPASTLLAELIAKGIAVKAATVADDLRETGAESGIGREALNYGHTLGHALERVHGFRLRHGEAISVGMVFVAELAHRLGRIDADLLARHRSILGSLGLPIHDDTAFDDLLAAMRLDKKTRGTQLRFVVLDGLAHPAVLADPDEQVLREAHQALRR